MLIQRIAYNNYGQKRNKDSRTAPMSYSSKPNTSLAKTTFKGDEFKKNEDSDDVSKLFADIKSEFKKLREDYTKPKNYRDILEKQNPERYNQFTLEKEMQLKNAALDLELKDIEQRNLKIENINTQFKFVNQVFSNSSNPNYTEDARIVLNFIKAMNNLEDGKGFKRIAGYSDEKKQLIDQFSLQTIGLAKTSQKVDVPNALLIYGPAGTGKTTFAHALAEQSLSHIDSVDAATMSPEEALEKVKNKAQIAKSKYELSGIEKKRTFILVNEADVISEKGTPIAEKFKNFIKTCAEDYKCTLFLTTNYPMDFDPELLSNDVTPIKIPLLPADRTTCQEIVEHRLNALRHSIDNIEPLVDKFFSKENGIFSNKDIVNVVDEAHKEIDKPTINDYIKLIIKENIVPSISKKKFINFPKTNEELFRMLKNIK